MVSILGSKHIAFLFNVRISAFYVSVQMCELYLLNLQGVFLPLDLR